MKRFLVFALLIAALPAFLSAGTIFESEKKTSDPFVGDRGGFNSLFVNPAGAAGQSGFELSVSAGARSKVNDIKLLSSMAEVAVAMQDSGGTLDATTISEVSGTFSDLYDAGIINDTMLDVLFDGTSLDPLAIDWSDPAAVEAAAAALTGPEIDAIELNFEEITTSGSPEAMAFFGALPEVIKAEALATLKTGFLIKGFGLGVYDQANGVVFMDPATGDYGIESVYNEVGVIAGGGFNLLKGKLALGFSGNYGVLMKNANPVNFDNMNSLLDGAGSISYGYNWGVDLGLIWRPAPSLGVGLVFNDVIGYSQTDTPYTADGLSGFIASEAYLMDVLEYEVTFDMDAGVSWQPDWRFVRPKFSFDLYNVIGYATDVAENGDDFGQAMYRSLEHMRFGANFTFFEFLKVGSQYYNHYLSVGAGLDLLFLELYGEFKVRDDAFSADNPGDVPIGGDLMVRIHF